MYELIRAGENSFYIDCPARMGLVTLGENRACLIDSGGDKDTGRKIRQILDQNGLTLTAIYNTHANADHIGGNRYLQGQTGCHIYAPGIDCAFTRHPILEPAFLYGGFAPSQLRHKFLLAQESDAQPLTPESLPEGMRAIPLPGHFFDMTGFRTADEVVYLADCLSSEETLQKYQISFIYDVKAYLETLEMVKRIEARLFVPAHAAPTEQIAPLAEKNIEKVWQVAEEIVRRCAEPISFEDLLKQLFDGYGLTLDFAQYVLVGSTVRSYLSWLSDAGQISAEFCDNRLLWRKG